MMKTLSDGNVSTALEIHLVEFCGHKFSVSVPVVPNACTNSRALKTLTIFIDGFNAIEL